MLLPENDSQIIKLTDKFYQDHPYEQYQEILWKPSRSYNCILFETHYDYFICVPYRTNIRHNYAYKFKTSKRSKAHPSGLDFKKIVIIAKTEYLDNKDGIIDQDEYYETMANIEKIKEKALCFVEDYVNHINGVALLNDKEFFRRYSQSPLQYFHKELGIE